MKYIAAVLCLVQIAFAAPQQQPTAPNDIAEKVQQTIATAQAQAQSAVADLNAKVLETAGVKSNEELLNTVQTQAQTYAAQVKGVADKINQEIASGKQQVDGIVATIAQRISESAAALIANNDQAKVDQLQKAFSNVLEQTNALNVQLQAQGTQLQSILLDNVGKIYEQTLNSAKSIATQLDASAKQQ